MRLAVSGLVAEDAGSVAGAGFIVLRELLARGVEIDFYANAGYVAEPTGLRSPGFAYVGLDTPRLLRGLPPKAYFLTNWGLTPLVRSNWRRAFRRVARARHRVHPYDALLSLGGPPYFTLERVRTVSWLQGAPHTEVEALRRLRPKIVELTGRAWYYKLLAYYAPRRLYDRNLLRSCDVVICGSRWSQRALVRDGLPAEGTAALPYPIDLDLFRPPVRPAIDWSQPEILWLGRIVPRKRLDLLIDALPLVAERVPGVRVRIVGAAPYAPVQLHVLRDSPLRDRITHQSRAPRSEVPALLQRAAVVVQTSESEDFGSTVAEAQACGAPVVVGPTNGTADYVDPCSRVFDEYTPEAVADAIVQTLAARRDDPGRCEQSARTCAERNFAPAAVADELLGILGGAAGAGLGSGGGRP